MQRFRDRGFAVGNLTNVCVGSSRFGVQFILPIYLQTLRGQTPVEAGETMMVMALTTLATLPFAGKLAQRIGSRPLIISGLVMFGAVTLLLTTQTLSALLWMIVAIMVVQGVAYSQLQQVPVFAMSSIQKEQQKEVAHGSTLVTLLHSTAAPLGVVLLSSIVQSRSQLYSGQLAAQGLSGSLLQKQSTLLGMHDGFKVAALLLATALVAVCLVRSAVRRPASQTKAGSRATERGRV